MNVAVPHDTAKPWLTQGEDKRRAVQEMFAQIAPGYDRMNRLMSGNLDRRWRRAAVAILGIRAGDKALDLCCGTGDFMPLLDKAGATSVGLDFCLPMLEIARGKSLKSLGLGDACQLPVRNACLDVVTVGWGIRNVPDIDLAHREIARILVSGGRFVSLDMAIPRNPLIRFASALITQRILPKLGAMFSNKEAYEYLPESAQRFKTREELKASMEAAGLSNVGYRDFALGNVCMHWGTKS